jgi:hypothetical protein
VPSIDLPHELVARLSERGTSVDATAARAVTMWLDLTDGRSDRGSAGADLLDAIGSASRKEAPVPDREELEHWLMLLNRLLGADSVNN